MKRRTFLSCLLSLPVLAKFKPKAALLGPSPLMPSRSSP